MNDGTTNVPENEKTAGAMSTDVIESSRLSSLLNATVQVRVSPTGISPNAHSAGVTVSAALRPNDDRATAISCAPASTARTPLASTVSTGRAFTTTGVEDCASIGDAGARSTAKTGSLSRIDAVMSVGAS